MKFLIDRLAFRNALQRVEMGIDRKPTNPVYGGILIEASNSSLQLMTNDLDMAVRYRIDFVQVDKPGWAVIPGRELVDIIKDVESDTVTLTLNEKGGVELQAGEDVCDLVTFESSSGADATDRSESFPLVAALEGEADVVMDKGDTQSNYIQDKCCCRAMSRHFKFKLPTWTDRSFSVCLLLFFGLCSSSNCRKCGVFTSIKTRRYMLFETRSPAIYDYNCMYQRTSEMYVPAGR